MYNVGIRGLLDPPIYHIYRYHARTLQSMQTISSQRLEALSTYIDPILYLALALVDIQSYIIQWGYPGCGDGGLHHITRSLATRLTHLIRTAGLV